MKRKPLYSTIPFRIRCKKGDFFNVLLSLCLRCFLFLFWHQIKALFPHRRRPPTFSRTTLATLLLLKCPHSEERKKGEKRGEGKRKEGRKYGRRRRENFNFLSGAWAAFYDPRETPLSQVLLLPTIVCSIPLP